MKSQSGEDDDLDDDMMMIMMICSHIYILLLFCGYKNGRHLLPAASAYYPLFVYVFIIIIYLFYNTHQSRVTNLHATALIIYSSGIHVQQNETGARV